MQVRQLQAEVKEHARDLAGAKAATGELRGTLNEARAARQAAEQQARDYGRLSSYLTSAPGQMIKSPGRFASVHTSAGRPCVFACCGSSTV